MTFVLMTGGHNVGIVNPPSTGAGSFLIDRRRQGQRYRDPDTWAAGAELRAGSWWVAWQAWLEELSTAERAPPPGIGAPEHGMPPLGDAPGTYVRMP